VLELVVIALFSVGAYAWGFFLGALVGRAHG
jgi:hypothetical protein